MTARRNGSPGSRRANSQLVEHTTASRSLNSGSIALLANSGLTAFFGVMFWLVAARVLNTATVGKGAALVSALFTVSGLCQLNYARSLSGLLPSAIRPRRLLARVYGLTAVLGFAIGLATAFILPYATADFSYLHGNLVFVIIFAGSVVLWTAFTLEDTALTSVRRTTIIPFENGIYGILKLVCLVTLWRIGYRTSMALFISWVLPLVAIVIPINLFLFLRAFRGMRPARVQRNGQATLWVRYDLAGYLMWLAGTVPLPVLVLISAGAANAASFYVAFTIASAIDLLSLMLGNSLTSELSRNHGVMTPGTRSYMWRIWMMIAVMSVFLFALAPLVLQVFGDKYRMSGALVLRIFMIAILPRSVLFLGIAVQRSQGKGRSILLLQAISALGTLALGFILVRPLGAAGMATGWLLSSCVAALVAGFFLAQNAVKGRHRRERPGESQGIGQITRVGQRTMANQKAVAGQEVVKARMGADVGILRRT
jgi:O-antigen/teichoic acid export membrane protein